MVGDREALGANAKASRRKLSKRFSSQLCAIFFAKLKREEVSLLREIEDDSAIISSTVTCRSSAEATQSAICVVFGILVSGLKREGN